jgi:TadE-like protein
MMMTGPADLGTIRGVFRSRGLAVGKEKATVQTSRARERGAHSRIGPAALCRSERGAALVEAAIAFPLLIMLVFGIIGFARGYNAKLTVTHAARESVRTLAITKSAVQAKTRAQQAATGLNSALLGFSSTPCVSGNPTTVTLTYPFTFDIPVFGTKSITITSQGSMRCGG